MKVTRLGLVVLKIAVTAGLLWYLLVKIDVVSVASQLRSMQALWALGATGMLLAQLLLTGVRWRFVGQLVAAKINLPQTLRLVLIGQFFNQLLPSSIGGDGVRAWIASREGIPLGRAVVSILCDRIAGVMGLVVIVALSLLLQTVIVETDVPAAEKFVKIVTAFTVFGLIGLWLLGERVAKILMMFRLSRLFGIIIRDLRIVLFTSKKSLLVVSLAAVVQVLVVLVIYSLAQGMSVDLSVIHGLILVPLILVVSMIPISFAGWGIREGAMVVGLGFVGVASADALAISVAFGLAQIAIGLPGGAFWLFHYRR